MAGGPQGPYPGRAEAVFATEPCAPPRIPDPFLDHWVAPDDPARLREAVLRAAFLWGDELPSGDDTEGKSEYSVSFEELGPDLACSGHLRFVEARPDKVVLQETEDHDLNDNCPNEGTVTRTLSGDKLVYDYAGGGGTAHTTLERQ